MKNKTTDIILKKACRINAAFTLIELLVVIAIIALLVSILLPSLNAARDLAKRAVCMSNLKNIGTSLHMYANENDGFFPSYSESQHNEKEGAGFVFFDMLPEGVLWPDGGGWAKDGPSDSFIKDYLENWEILFCPSAEFSPTALEGYERNFTADPAYHALWNSYGYAGRSQENRNQNYGPLTPIENIGLCANTSVALPGDMLMVDRAAKISGEWSSNWKMNHVGKGGAPEGVNKLTVDGCVEWVQGSGMEYKMSDSARGYDWWW